MAFNPDYLIFNKTLWGAKLLKEVAKIMVMAQDCNKDYTGEAKQGSKVHILQVGKATIKDYDGDDIDSAEKPQGVNYDLEIDQLKYFNVGINVVDKKWSQDTLLSKIVESAKDGLAEAQDAFIAKKLATDSALIAGNVIDADTVTKEQLIDAINAGLDGLLQNGVAQNAKKVINLPVWAYRMLKEYLTDKGTDNTSVLERGFVGFYDGATVKVSNNLYNDGTNDNIIIRTPRAFAFVDQIEEFEAYRPEKNFGYASKGLSVYGGKICVPKEVFVVQAHKA